MQRGEACSLSGNASIVYSGIGIPCIIIDKPTAESIREPQPTNPPPCSPITEPMKSTADGMLDGLGTSSEMAENACRWSSSFSGNGRTCAYLSNGQHKNSIARICEQMIYLFK